ncbi:hypothetical protein LINPERPRIM_LOCUS16068, partial [Linum perenne]
ITILSLIIPPKLVNALPGQLPKEAIIIPISHLLIQLSHEPTPQPFTIIQKPSRDIIPLVPPVTLTGPHPVTRSQVSLQPHEICYPFYQPAGSSAVTVPLPHVRHLVIHNTRELPPQVPRVSVDVPGADVDLAVGRVGNSVHVVDEQADLLHGLSGGRVVLAERGLDEVCGG